MKWLRGLTTILPIAAVVILIAIVVVRLLDIFLIPTDALNTTNAKEVIKELSVIRKEGIGALLISLLQSAFIEEIIFRFLPLVFFAKWVTSNNQIVCAPTVRTIVVVLVTTLCFGWVHGSVWCILAQGVLGLALSVIFIIATHVFTTGVFLGRFKKALIALVVSTVVHTYYNFLIVV